jgi:LmbE family N-acetylglucosaminyl deacetylase
VIGGSFASLLPESARVLVIGAHADDIEIGCGGTLLRMVDEVPSLDVTWVVLSADGERGEEARTGARAFVGGAHSSDVVIGSFQDGYLPYVGSAVKDFFEDLARRVDPHLILTHARADLHQDHRLACELTWNTWRNHLVFEYEIPKYDGDLGTPNVFVTLTGAQLDRKIELLMGTYATQRSKHWFTEDLLMALPRVRGMEARSESGLAEGFTCRKLSI